MNVFHSSKNCTDRRCLVHGLSNIADNFEKASREIRELNEKLPVKSLNSIAQAVTYSDEYRKNCVADGDDRTLRQILDDIDRKLNETAELQELHQEVCK
ncbi:hypothetical protein [Nonomuraea wenchangensis]|uniref:Uncharacterized protein n=1 Tax=Nonomuraea wenchangensis TaxID=568860 RepID=A0A1I0LF12_9ACTN|nr:hypothetical protein [Nonomuraea wenchangensis]SEU38700.1 hypothetical protein SAMN05421811_1167 [Nonomuraea wenchangensis]